MEICSLSLRERLAKFEAVPARKSVFSDSKEITKPAVFAQPLTLLELARSDTERTILRNITKG